MTDEDDLPDDVTLTATGFKVHAREKVSTGDYENAEYHTTVEGAVAEGELTPEARKELKARLLSLHKDVQEVVERAGENRLALPEAEDWGVHNGNGGEDE